MLRLVIAATLILGCVATDPDYHCSGTNGDATGFPKEVCYIDSCTTAIKNHIHEELGAAFKYMHMGAFFAQESVARPGMAKFMLESATEERSHAILMLDYLNKRGVKIGHDMGFSFSQNNLTEEVLKDDITFKFALKEALKMEIQVTDLIYKVIKECEDDYHGADVFTNPILDEQHDGVRKLQGALREFSDLEEGHGDAALPMVEFIYDQKMLKEPF